VRSGGLAPCDRRRGYRGPYRRRRLLVLRRQFEGTATVLLRRPRKAGLSGLPYGTRHRSAAGHALQLARLPARNRNRRSSRAGLWSVGRGLAGAPGPRPGARRHTVRCGPRAGNVSGLFRARYLPFRTRGRGGVIQRARPGVRPRPHPASRFACPWAPLRCVVMVSRSRSPSPSWTRRRHYTRGEATQGRKGERRVAQVTSGPPTRSPAAAVPNAAIAIYLERRKTTDRGTNQRRLEFLVGSPTPSRSASRRRSAACGCSRKPAACSTPS